MHHLVSGINSLIHSVNLAIRVSTHFLIHLSAHLCHHHHSHHPSLQAQNLPFQQILPTLTLLLPSTAITITGPDQTYMLLGLFLVRFYFNFWPTVRSGLCHRKSVCLSVRPSVCLWPNGLSDGDDFWHTPCPGQQ